MHLLDLLLALRRPRAPRAPGALLVGLALVACTPTETPQLTTIQGAQFLALRCVQPGGDGLSGLPLHGCGCTVSEGEGAERRLRQLGRVECACELLEVGPGGARRIVPVKQVRAECAPVVDGAGCVVDWGDCADRPGRGPDGDFSPAERAERPARVVDGALVPAADCPAPPPRVSVACLPQGGGQLRGYVGAGGEGRVTVLDLTAGEDSDSGNEPKRILDVARSIPGITAVFVDDLISDVLAHPFGAFIASVNSTTGSLTIIRDEANVTGDLQVNLGIAPLFKAVTWPPIEAPTVDLDAPPRAWISAPTAGAVVPVDLAAIEAGRPETAVGDPIPVTGRGGQPAAPARLALSPDGLTLFAADSRAPTISVLAVDPASGGAVQTGLIDLVAGGECADGYLVRTVSAAEDDSCHNGLDDDGDGLVDGADPDCGDAAGSERQFPRCAKRSQCADGVDNDGDGLVDLEDPDCQVETCDAAGCRRNCQGAADCARFLDWEGPIPECSNGVDDDGDGLIDREDPDCLNEADDQEASDAEEEVSRCRLAETVCQGDGAPGWCALAAQRCGLSSCEDGDDNDGDGLIDGADEDCAACPEASGCQEGRGLPRVGDDDPCHNGLDDDDDGLIDGEDPGCWDFNAEERFSFERPPRCNDGLDNDGDGLIDLEDPDCSHAASDNESPPAQTVGPRQLVVAHVPLHTGLRRFLYVLEPAGALLVVDLDDPALRPRRIPLPAASLAMALRQYDGEASLLVLGADTLLRSVEITTPTPIVTDDGRPVFVRIHPGEIAGVRTNRVRPYIIEAGVAVDVAPAEGGGLTADHLGARGPLWQVLTPDAPRRFVRAPRPEGTEAIRAGAPAAPGNDDLQLMAPLNERRILHAEANLLGSAFARTNMLSASPRLLINTSQIGADRARHPTLCLPDQLDRCVPAGSTADGGRETPEAAAVRDPDRIETVAAVQVVEDDPQRLISGTFTLAYEGTLPGTESRTGLHAGRTTVTDLQGDPAEGWVLVDYETDFCRRGVEVGDVVLVDRFRAVTVEAGESALCQPFEPVLSQNPSLAREPLRYVAVEVSARKLVLAPDRRTEYCVDDPDGQRRCQLPRGVREPAPTLAEPPPAPPFACAAQFISYRVRAGNDQWLLTGSRSGYRHPWRTQGGTCALDAGLVAAGRIGRAQLGVPFENEWFRLRLGASTTSGGVPADRLPHLVDVALQFDVRSGRQTRGLADAAVIPQQAVWSPGDDRLYVVDTAVETVTEIGGLSVFERPMQVIRRIR